MSTIPGFHVAPGRRRALTQSPSSGTERAIGLAGILALAFLALPAARPAARADPSSAAVAEAARARAVRMQRFIVSATRVDKNPWRYATLPGFEILSRAPDKQTFWMLDALRRGLWLQNDVMPKDWLPQSPVPYTVIIDDTDLSTVPVGKLHSQPIKLASPVDAVAWGEWSNGAMVWTDQIPAYDSDTLAFNTNVFGVEMRSVSYGSVSLERLSRCTPPLPQWLMAGLIARDCGVFREGFMPIISEGVFGPGWIHRADGPGTLWISVDETNRLIRQLKDDGEKGTTTPIAMLPLRELFSETPPHAEHVPLWESEAALFVRWGLMGPGSEDPDTAHAFLELVRRARRERVTEQMFTDCFGFGYATMEGKLLDFLKAVLAHPTSVGLDIPSGFPKPKLKAATADQIGRIIGDWLRMQGDTFRRIDPAMARESLYYAGRMLERAYREDNGLPPDVDPARKGDKSPVSPQGTAAAPAIGMKPFVVTADRIHDARLLAVYGLYEHDMGNDAKARELLEAAVASGVMRPNAYVVLARLRFAEAMAGPMGREGRLSARQAAGILEPLRTALQFGPNVGVYSMIVGTWTKSEAKPTKDDIDEIAKGVALYPRNTDLAYNSALVCSDGGYAATASQLIDGALVFAENEARGAYLENLRSTLNTPAGPNNN